MKTRLLIVFILLLAAATYYIVELRPKSSVGFIIPETSLIAFESPNLSETMTFLRSKEWFSEYEQLPKIQEMESVVSKIDSLMSTGQLNSNLSSLPITISLHSSGEEGISVLYILESKGFEWTTEGLQSLVGLAFGKEVSITTQTLEGGEYYSLDKGFHFSFAGKYLSFSTSPVLVEDVLRSRENENAQLKIDENRTGLGKDELYLFFNASRLAELSDVFFSNKQQYNLADGVYTIKLSLNDQSIVFDGRAINGLGNSPKAELIAENFVSLEASQVSWSSDIASSGTLGNYLGSEYAKISLNKGARNELFIWDVSNEEKLLELLKNEAQKQLQVSDSVIYNEQYINNTIGHLKDPSIITEIFEDNKELTEAYYTTSQGFLIVSKDLESIKQVLSDNDNENTWGKSVPTRQIIDGLIQQTDYSLIYNMDFGYESFFNQLRPKWQALVEANPALLQNVHYLFVQLNNGSNNRFVSGSIDMFNNEESRFTDSSVGSETVDLGKEKVIFNAFSDANIYTKPFIVRNHNTNTLEVLFQDELNQLYLLSDQGDIQWKTELDGLSQTDIFQIDYYKNRKLQYLMVTDSLMHLIDRNGNAVDGFPVQLNISGDINGLEVVDYDGSKNYRYLVSTRQGDVYLFNKEGAPLDGWNPKSFDNTLLETPFHTRVRGRDVFVMAETTGQLNLLNRRAQDYSNFPLDSDLRFRGDLVYRKGANLEESQVVLLDRRGQLVKINFNGQMVERDQLLKSEANNEFVLVDDKLGTDYRIVRYDRNRIVVFDSNNDEVLSYPRSTNQEFEFGYYNFRNGKDIFVIHDKSTQSVTIINKDGTVLSENIPASKDISVLYYQSRKEYEVFVNFENQLNVYAVSAQ